MKEESPGAVSICWCNIHIITLKNKENVSKEYTEEHASYHALDESERIDWRAPLDG